MRYVAFLRAVNVGGRNQVSMAALKEHFEALGFTGVRTFINSGNIVFAGAPETPAALARRLSRDLAGWLGFPVGLMVRRLDALATLVRQRPFGELTGDGPLKRYVVFLEKPVRATVAELCSAKEGLETLKVRGEDVFLLSHPLRGHFGFPNLFFEKQLEVAATSRNWSTIEMIVEACSDAEAGAAARPRRRAGARGRKTVRRARP